MTDPRTDTAADTNARTITRLTMDAASAQSRARTAERQRTAATERIGELERQLYEQGNEVARLRAFVEAALAIAEQHGFRPSAALDATEES